MPKLQHSHEAPPSRNQALCQRLQAELDHQLLPHPQIESLPLLIQRSLWYRPHPPTGRPGCPGIPNSPGTPYGGPERGTRGLPVM